VVLILNTKIQKGSDDVHHQSHHDEDRLGFADETRYITIFSVKWSYNINDYQKEGRSGYESFEKEGNRIYNCTILS
jgi:hypothetical protein